jgi:hypothetical protein
LSAKQGVVLKALIDAISIPTKTSQLSNDSNFVSKEVTDELSREIDNLPNNETLINNVANKVPTQAKEPTFANGVGEMTDTGKVYVNMETGTFWTYKETIITQTVRNDIVGTTDNPYVQGRLPSSGTTPTAASGYVISPWIDITKDEYQGKTIKLHLEGLRYITETYETYVQNQVLGTDKTTIVAQRTYSSLDSQGNLRSIAGSLDNVNLVDANHAILTITIPKKYGTGSVIGYLRFCAAGEEADSSIYITYEQTVQGLGWVDTYISYTPNVTEEEKQQIANDIISMIDTELLSVVGSGEVV